MNNFAPDTHARWKKNKASFKVEENDKESYIAHTLSNLVYEAVYNLKEQLKYLLSNIYTKLLSYTVR